MRQHDFSYSFLMICILVVSCVSFASDTTLGENHDQCVKAFSATVVSLSEHRANRRGDTSKPAPVPPTPVITRHLALPASPGHQIPEVSSELKLYFDRLMALDLARKNLPSVDPDTHSLFAKDPSLKRQFSDFVSWLQNWDHGNWRVLGFELPLTSSLLTRFLMTVGQTRNSISSNWVLRNLEANLRSLNLQKQRRPESRFLRAFELPFGNRLVMYRRYVEVEMVVVGNKNPLPENYGVSLAQGTSASVHEGVLTSVKPLNPRTPYNTEVLQMDLKNGKEKTWSIPPEVGFSRSSTLRRVITTSSTSNLFYVVDDAEILAYRSSGQPPKVTSDSSQLIVRSHDIHGRTENESVTPFFAANSRGYAFAFPADNKITWQVNDIEWLVQLPGPIVHFVLNDTQLVVAVRGVSGLLRFHAHRPAIGDVVARWSPDGGEITSMTWTQGVFNFGTHPEGLEEPIFFSAPESLVLR
jgi:hypothetical protein